MLWNGAFVPPVLQTGQRQLDTSNVTMRKKLWCIKCGYVHIATAEAFLPLKSSGGRTCHWAFWYSIREVILSLSPGTILPLHTLNTCGEHHSILMHCKMVSQHPSTGAQPQCTLYKILRSQYEHVSYMTNHTMQHRHTWLQQ